MTWSVLQTAEFLGLQPKTVRSLARDRKIPAAKLGKVWRFDETTLREWLQNKTRENIAPCRSEKDAAPRIGKFVSGSLETQLDAALKQQTKRPPRPSNRNFALISGGKSSSENDDTPGTRL